jgi:hypothetical protein
MDRINPNLAGAPGDCATLRLAYPSHAGCLARLKSDNRVELGLKSDFVAYEIIANALSDDSPCIQRARIVLHALAQACAGEETPYFEVVEGGEVPRLVFRPCP